MSSGSWDALASGHVDVLSKLGSVPSSDFGDFYGGFIEEAQPLIGSVSDLSPLLRGGLKVPSFLLWLGLSGDQPPSCSPPGALQESPH